MTGEMFELAITVLDTEGDSSLFGELTPGFSYPTEDVANVHILIEVF